MSELRVTGLDFDEIKQNLKNYMKSQDQFKDFDFDGAGLSVILDILAYNSHYMGMYAHFAASEAHLTPAKTRTSVVSRAKELGYTPRSVTAPKAVVSITAITSEETSNAQETSPGSGIYEDISKHGLASKIIVAPGKKFTASVDGVVYEFTNTENIVFTKTNTTSDGNTPPKYTHTFVAEDIVLTQGNYLTYKWTFSANDPGQRFIIPNADVDTTTLVVNVYKSSTDKTKTIFYPASSFSRLDGANPAYWIWEVEDGKFELEFGDNVLGKALETGNQIEIIYIVTDGKDANFCKTFTMAGTADGITNTAVTTETTAYGGADRESLDSIKFSAVRQYSAQNRAVTATDFETIIKQKFPVAESVAVWGGETMDPPEYGKVYVSIKPSSGIILTETIKRQIVDSILDDYVIVSVTPVIVQPEYLQIVATVDVEYDARSTTKTRAEVASLVANTVVEYGTKEVSVFGAQFKYSDFLCYIQDSETFIVSVLATIHLKKRFEPSLTSADVYTIDFVNEIEPGTISAKGFKVNDAAAANPSIVTHEFYDDSAGNIDLYRNVAGVKTKIASKIGSVNYTTGVITLDAFDPISVTDVYGFVYINCTPASQNLEVNKNNIITVDLADITVNAEPSY